MREGLRKELICGDCHACTDKTLRDTGVVESVFGKEGFKSKIYQGKRNTGSKNIKKKMKVQLIFKTQFG